MSKKKLHIGLSAWAKVFTGFVLTCCLFSAEVKAQSSVNRAYQVKAAFLYNFSQFVEWPPEAFAGPSAPFVIGVVGADPFGTYLDELVKGEKINGHPIVVQRYAHEKEVQTCHILFINSTNPYSVLSDLENRSILTVSDADNFASQGGMIRFFTEKNKIRLQINPLNAKTARLSISSKLLRVSEIVENKR